MLVFERLLDRFEALLGDLLNLNDMLATDLLALLDDEFTGQDDILGSGRVLEISQALLDNLGFLHQFVGARADAILEAIDQRIAGGFQFPHTRGSFAGRLLELLLKLGLKLCFGLLQFLTQAFERALPSVFIHAGDYVLGKIENPVQVAARNIEQQAHIAGNTASVPDMGDRGGQLDMAEAFTTYGRTGDLYPALVADDPFITDVLVFTAVALPISGGAENSLTEQTIFLRSQPAIVDRLRLGDLTIRPGADLLRGCQADA